MATAPAVLHVGSHFLAQRSTGYGEAAPGDHLQSAYRLWLVGDDLEHGRYPWRDPYSFRPESRSTLNPAGWPFGLLFWPLWRALGLVGAWNLLVLLSFVAAGGFACAWLRELGLSRIAALVGGLVFCLAPYRVAQSTGHLLGLISVLLPLSLLALERGLRSSRWWLVLSLAALASIPLSGQVHLALGTTPFYVAYALVRSRSRRSLAAAAVGALSSTAAGILIQREAIAGSIAAGGRSLEAVSRYSASWLDFVARHERHGLEQFVFLGWLVPLTALLGLVALWQRRQRSLATVLGLGAVLPMVLALGTHTPFYRAVRFAVPPFRYPRVPERLMPVACLCLAALVAYVVAEVGRRAADTRLRVLPGPLVVGAVCVLLVFLDLRVSVFGSDAADAANRAYAAVRHQPPGRVAELPFTRPGSDLGSPYLYYETQLRRLRPGGYSTTAPKAADAVAKALLPLNCGDWSANRGQLLRRLGVTTVVFHRALFESSLLPSDTAWFAWRGLIRHGWRQIARDGPLSALARRGRVPPHPPAAEPSHNQVLFCDGWLPNDGRGRPMGLPHAAIWMYDSGDFRLFLESKTPLPTAFSVDGQRVAQRLISGLTVVRVPVGRLGWHLIALDAPRGTHGGAHLVGYTAS